MVTITATVDAATATTRLTVTGGAPDYVVTAIPAAGRPEYIVRGPWVPIPGDATGRAATDGDVPLNFPTAYTVTDRVGAQASTPAVTVPATRPVLASSLNPAHATLVTVVSQPPNEYQARSVWWDVLGASAPFASIAPARLRAGTLVLRTTTQAERAALRSLILTGHPLSLRSTCPDTVDDIVLLPGAAREELALADAPRGARHWSIQYQALSRDALGPVGTDPGRSYSTLLTEDSTYAAVSNRFATYTGLLAGWAGT